MDRARHRARLVGAVPTPDGLAPRRSPLHVADEDDAPTTAITATLYALPDAPTVGMHRVPAAAPRRPEPTPDRASQLARFNRTPWIAALFLALMAAGAAVGLFVVLPLLLDLANVLSFLLPAVFTLPAAILLPAGAWFTYRIITKRNTDA